MDISEKSKLRSIIESLMIVSSDLVSAEEIRAVIQKDWPLTTAEIRAALYELQKDYEVSQRGLRIVEIAEKFQLCTSPENAEWVKRYLQEKNVEKLSKPALETLAIIAYRQPLTKLEMEGIRGVNVDGVMKKLLDRGLIAARGRREILGHPNLYVTTDKFLEYFGLKNLDDLPQRSELLSTMKPISAAHLTETAVQEEVLKEIGSASVTENKEITSSEQTAESA